MTPFSRVSCLIASFFLLAISAPAGAQSMFSHQIPIKLPKGANGMHPELALTYSPGAGNGIVGVGWQLVGLSSISRVAYANDIKYAGGDAYAHSQLGVLVRQPDGSYRSRTESFVKLIPSSATCGDGPQHWIAYHPSGLRSYYGTVGNCAEPAKVLAQAWNSVVTWHLAKVEDLFGNSYEVSYTPDAANGQAYPLAITYTKASNIASTAWRTVQFTYESRTDTEPNYARATVQQTTSRLKWIEVKSGGALVRKYRLDYECGGSATCSGSLTSRSRLTAVTEYGSDGTSTLPAQTFAYQAGTSARVSSAAYLPPSGSLVNFSGREAATPGGWDGGMRLADLDGDGRPDLIQAFQNYGTPYLRAWLNTGSGWAASNAFAPPPSPIPSSIPPVFSFRNDTVRGVGLIRESGHRRKGRYGVPHEPGVEAVEAAATA